MKNQCYCNSSALQVLNYLPRRILELKDQPNKQEFIMHSLCNKDCFNIEKAAYFIDNPDFDCIKGVTGYSASEVYKGDIWSNPKDFSDYMAQAIFNKKVRDIQGKSCTMHHESHEHALHEIANMLGIEKYNVCNIPIPHENHGYFIYELQKDTGELDNELILNGISLLSFCPLY
ncbi:MAG TPA: hypothetical protein VGW78_01410 [Candidatus Babeliales bacterium]|jgi:hypothetical protein|nr:hypothetical protein [Candidatus Babeliales bacterium]